MHVPFAPESLQTGWRWLRWRAVAMAIVFTMGLAAFLMGVDVSEEGRHVAEADVMTKVYYTLGLFVLGGLDLGVPRSGALAGRIMLWFAYFLAPAITASALIESLLRVIQPRSWRLRRIRDHVVIVGCGRLALLYLERLREIRPNQAILVVELHPDKADVKVASERYRAELLFGDVTSEAVLDSLRLDRARRVVLLTGDDFTNLDTASRIRQKAAHLDGNILVHVADIRLLRTIEKSDVLRGCETFNTFQIAARHLVRDQLLPHFVSTKATDTVILAGFGRFGQTVLDQLQAEALGQFATVVILDPAAEAQSIAFEDQVGFAEGYRREVRRGDMSNPLAWKAMDDVIQGAHHALVVVLGADDDGTNIRTALWLSSRYHEAYIVARCFYHSSFTEQLSHECAFEIVSTADLLVDGMDEDWFSAKGAER